MNDENSGKDEGAKKLFEVCCRAREQLLTTCELFLDGGPGDGQHRVYSLYVALSSLARTLEPAFVVDELISLDDIAESFVMRDHALTAGIFGSRSGTVGKGGDA